MSADGPPPPTPRQLRPGGIRLGRVFGVPVYLRWSWLILAFGVISLYAVSAGFLFCLLLSVLLHELGHALVARRYKIGVRAITLELLGGYTEMESDSPSARADLFVSIIGPIISGVIGGGALALYLVL